MTNKEKYIRLCADAEYQKMIPVFSMPYWLDAVAESWDVSVAIEKGKVTGVLPYCLKGNFVTRRIYIPELTSYSGPVLFYPENLNEYEKRSFEKKVITELLDQLPKPLVKTSIKCYPEIDNWLPFSWAAYSQTTRYTYIISDIKKTQTVFYHFKDSHQRQIRKAQKADLFIQTCSDVGIAFEILKNTFDKQQIKTPFTKKQLNKIYEMVKENHCGEILIARNKSGKSLACIFIVWDNLYTYYLSGGFEESDANSGAMTYLFWHAIQEAKKHSAAFNFEGSMIEGVERYFRGFGGNLVPVHYISK
ncbi:MAG: hypothetical protein JWN78_1823 [Bacteroidota bacterium]|nr:hypothetical protein [Bacteroidota bacterium]